MPKELSCVALVSDLPAHGLRHGTIGTIVHVYPGETAFEVEFSTHDGLTIDVVTLEAKGVRPLSFDQVRQARFRQSLDRLSAQVGPRLTIPLIRERLDPSSLPSGTGGLVKEMKRLQVVTRKGHVKTRRFVQVNDPVQGTIFYDLKAVEPARRQVYLSTLGKYIKVVRSNPLDARIPRYQYKLRELIETPSK